MEPRQCESYLNKRRYAAPGEMKWQMGKTEIEGLCACDEEGALLPAPGPVAAAPRQLRLFRGDEPLLSPLTFVPSLLLADESAWENRCAVSSRSLSLSAKH